MAVGGRAGNRRTENGLTERAQILLKIGGIVQLGPLKGPENRLEMRETGPRPLLALTACSAGEVPKLSIVAPPPTTTRYVTLPRPPYMGYSQFGITWSGVASLRGVVGTTTYVYAEGGGGEQQLRRCRGLVLRYGDGTTRTLGQCRVGIDEEVHTQKPVGLCYMNMVDDGSVALEFLADGAEPHAGHVSGDDGDEEEEDGWACHAMEGGITFWFIASYARMMISGLT